MESNSIAQLLGVYKINGASDVHLLEFIFNIPPTDVDVSSFTQEDDKLPKDSWQTAYDERFLNHDGTKVIGTFLEQRSLTGDQTRIVFFMYYINFNKSLLSQFGEILLSEPSPIPDRLSEIIELELVD